MQFNSLCSLTSKIRGVVYITLSVFLFDLCLSGNREEIYCFNVNFLAPFRVISAGRVPLLSPPCYVQNSVMV